MRDRSLSISDSEAIKQVVSGQLKAARQLRQMSLRQAAPKLSISPSYLAQIEQGKRNLPIELLFKASRQYQVSVDVLLGREPLPGNNRSAKVIDLVSAFFRAVEHQPGR